VHLRERSPRDGIQFNPTAQSRKGRSPLQFAKQLLRRGALSSKVLDESSLDVGLWDPTVKPGSELPQGVPWVRTQTEVHLSLRDCLIQYLFVIVLKTSRSHKVSESWFPSWWPSFKAIPTCFTLLIIQGQHREPAYSSLIILYARRTSTSFGESVSKLTSSV